MATDFDGADEEVEFLDLGTDTGSGPDGSDAENDDVDWLDEPGGEERVASGRDPLRLPPRAARGRALASVLSLATVLSAVIGVGTVAYHRHETDVRAANLVKLTASSTAPSIPGLTELAFDPKWHGHVSEHIVIPVVNKGPHAITLMDGKLSEAGLQGAPMLEPVGKATIQPGGTGELGGTVTADCTTEFSNLTMNDVTVGPGTTVGTTTATVVLDGDSTDGSATATKPQTDMGALKVRARSVSGHVGEQTIFPEPAVGNTAERICAQQGRKVAQLGTVHMSADSNTRTFTVSLTAKSMADTPLEYESSATWDTLPGAVGLELQAGFSPTSEDALVQPGGTFTASFQMTVVTCPTSATFHDDQITLAVTFASSGGYLISGETQAVAARPLIYEACGLPADWKG